MNHSKPSSERAMRPGFLETMTITDVENFHPEVVVIPLGSTEPHGPHLPYVTDTMDIRALAEHAVSAANEKDARVLLLPTLPYGNNVNFKKFPFACRIKVRTLMAIIRDLVEFCVEEGVRKVVFLNGHGGNTATIQATLREVHDCFQDQIFVCMTDQGPGGGEVYKRHFKDGSLHAGDFETSLVMHLAPHLVDHCRLEEQPMEPASLDFLNGGTFYWVRPWHQYLPSSSGGRPDHSTPEKGKEFFECCVKYLSEVLIKLSKTPWKPGFPYEDKASSQKGA